MSNIKHYILTIITTLSLLGSTYTIADDIYVIPKSDTPIDEEQYSEKINLEANDTTVGYTPAGLPDNEGTEDPYIDRNVSPEAVKSNIINNNFFNITVLKANPGNIANDTENLLSGKESDIVTAPDSRSGQSGISIDGKGDTEQLE